MEDGDAHELHPCMFCMDVQSWRRLSTHSRLVDSVPSTYAKTAYKRLSFAQRIFVSELVSFCFHVLLCRDWTLFFVWSMRLHDAARDVGFPPLLVYVLRKDRFSVCCLEERLR